MKEKMLIEVQCKQTEVLCLAYMLLMLLLALLVTSAVLYVLYTKPQQ